MPTRSSIVLGLLATLMFALGDFAAPAPALAEGANGPKAFLQPQAAQEFFGKKRRPPGESTVPIDRYSTAREHVNNMPVYSTAADAERPSLNGSGLSSTASTVLGTWSPLGPGNVGGRTRAILIHPTTPATMYAAGAAGGVWKSTDGGASWTPVSDLIANLAVTTLAFAAGTPDTIYAGTGEGFFNADAARGAGIFKSTDAGASWTQLESTNEPNFYYVNKLAVTPNNTLYAATRSGVWRSGDGGGSWTQAIVGGDGGCSDLARRTDQPEYVFASCGLGGTQGTIHRSTSGGVFTQVFAGESGMGRTSLAIAPSNQAIVYALAATTMSSDGTFGGGGLHAVFKSTASGNSGTWTATVRNTSTTKLNTLLLTNPVFAYLETCFPGFGPNEFLHRGGYASVIAVDPLNPNVVWAGGVDLFRSDSGGTAWGLASNWWFDAADPAYAHADHHTIVFHPAYNGTTNKQMFVGNDGGITRVTDARASTSTDVCNGVGNTMAWSTLNNGYGVTQFHHGAPYPDGNTFFGGTQGNGIVRGNVANGQVWTSLLPGEGGYVAVDPDNTDVLYAANTGASIQKSIDGGQSFVDADTGLDDGGFLLIAPFVMDPNQSSRLWAGGFTMRRTDNGAGSWTQASTPLCGAGSVSAIAVAPGNPNVVLSGMDDGCINRTTAATTATATTAWTSTMPRSGYVSSLAFDPTDANVVYATYSTFGGTHVWRSADGGQTWTGIDGSGATAVPDIPVHTLVVNPSDANRLYVGTDLGVFVSRDGGGTWAVENTGFANVITEALAIATTATGTQIYAFTHGRGAWRVATAEVPAVLTVTIAGGGGGSVSSTPSGIDCGVDCTEEFPADPTVVTLTPTPASGSVFAGWRGISGCSGTDDCIVAMTAHRHATATFELPSLVELTSAAYSVSEAGTTATITANRSGGTGVVTVAYTTSDGTAIDGIHYTAAGGTLTFADGESSKSFTIPIADDTNADGPRTVNVTLSDPSPTASLGTMDTAVLTITDDEAPGTIRLSAATYTVAEGGSATITVTRTGSSLGGNVSVTYTLSGGTATAGLDYTNTSATLTFDAAQTTKTFTVPTLHDTLAEGAETVLITLSDATNGATLGAPGAATLSITDNDHGGIVKLSAATYTVGEGAGAASILVQRTPPAGATAASLASNVSLTLSMSSATATGGVDFTNTSQTLTFAAAQTSLTFLVPIDDDTAPEGNEAFTVTLGDLTSGATLATPSTAVVTIVDDEQSLNFSAASYSVTEGTPATITVTRSGPTTAPATVQYVLTDGTASAGTHYTNTSATLTFPVGVASKTFTVATTQNAVLDGARTVSLALATPSGAGVQLGSLVNAVLTINDNDVPGVLRFGLPSYSVGEGGVGTITVTRAIPAGSPAGSTLGGTVSVDVASTGGTATGGADYTNVSRTLTFTGAEASKTFTVTTTQDTAAEGAETVQLTLSNPTNGATVAPNAAATPNPVTMTITDNDNGGVVKFSTAAAAVTEGATATITVLRTGTNLAGPVTVAYAVTGGTAEGSGVDYTLASGVLTFNAGAASASVTVPTVNDAVGETNETVIVTLSGPTGGATVGTPATTVLTITDNDAGLHFSATSYTTLEGSAAVITVQRNAPATGTATVLYATSDGTAVAGTHYTAASGALTFGPGVLTRTFSVLTSNNTLVDGARTVSLMLGTAGGGATLGAPATAVLTINDNDQGGVIAFSSSASSVVEGATATIGVTRTGTSLGAATVDYAFTGTATGGGTDYTAVAGTLSFATGQTSRTVTIPTVNDTVREADETVVMTLSNATGGATIGAVNPATLTIRDNDNAGQFRFSAAAYSVNRNVASTLITVMRTGTALAGNISVTPVVTGGTAVGGVDYEVSTGPLTFGAGETSRAVLVDVLSGNSSVTITFGLTDPTHGATLGAPSTAVLTLTPTSTGELQFNTAASSVVEGGTATITVTRTAPITGTALVSYAASNGNATATQDYTAVSGTLTFGPGITSRTFSVPTINDTLNETAETVLLTLSNPQGGAALGATSTATLTIVDNDTPGAVRLSAGTYSVTEGGNAAIVVSRTGGAASGVTVMVTTSDDTAVGGTDYTSVSQTLTFAAGQTSRTVFVPTLTNTMTQPSRSFTVTLSNPGGGASLGSPASAGVAINDNDPSGTFQFGSAAYAVNRQAGSAVLTIVRNTATSEASVTAFTTSGTAEDGTDFTGVSSTLVFNVGVAVKTLPIAILTPGGGADRRFTVTLQSIDGSTVATGPLGNATVTITEPMTPSLLSFDADSYTVAESVANRLITVIRTGSTTGTVTVGYATGGGNATATQDYRAAAGTLTFGPGITSRTFTVPILNDNVVEGVETVELALSNPLGGALLGNRTTATLSITPDGDAGGSIRLGGNVSVTEGGTATVTVIRSGGTLAGGVTVSYATSDGSAVAGEDYTNRSGTLTFNAGETTRTFTVPTTADMTAESAETITVTLSDVAGATLGTPAAGTITITDNDTNVQFSAADYAVPESNGGTVTITVNRTGIASGTSTVGFTTVDGTAIAGTDYVATSGTLTFRPGETSAAFMVTVLDNLGSASDTQLTVQLSAPTGATVHGATATVSITNTTVD